MLYEQAESFHHPRVAKETQTLSENGKDGLSSYFRKAACGMLFYLLLFDPHGQVLIQHLSLVFPESYPVTFCVRESGRREAVGCNKDN